MRKDRTMVIVIGVITIIIAIVLCIIFLAKSNKNNGETTVSDNTVTLEPEATTEPVVQLDKPEDVKTEDGYTKFVYDANESMEDYFKSKVSIQGSGTVVDIQTNKTDENGITYGTGDMTQEYWYESSEDRSNYIHAVTAYDFSKGFGPVLSVKYDIGIQSIIGSMAIMNAPNNTILRVSERDYTEGDATYWHKKIMGELGHGYTELVIPVDSIPYNTPFIIGTGLEDWTPYEKYNSTDITVNTTSTQLLCDISVDTIFGEGYYIETFNNTSGCFEGHLIIQHGDRVFVCEGTSEYRDSIKDICTACLDRCITVY